MSKRTTAIISSMLLSVSMLSVGSLAHAEAGADTDTQPYIKAEIQFTDGTAETQKLVQNSIFGFLTIRNTAESPDPDAPHFYGFQYGDKLEFEYLIEDDIAGLGNMNMQASNWDDFNKTYPEEDGTQTRRHLDENGDAYGTDFDQTTAALGQWHKKTIALAGPFTGNEEGKWAADLAHIVIACDTKDAVDTSKTYVAKYRNIRIKHADNTYFDLFTAGSYNAEELPVKEAESFGTPSNATMKLSVVNPTDDGNPTDSTTDSTTNNNTTTTEEETTTTTAEEKITKPVIKADIKFSKGEEGVRKYAAVSVIGNRLERGLEDITFRSGDVFEFEYAITDKVVGLGNMNIQCDSSWAHFDHPNVICDSYDEDGEMYTTEFDLTGKSLNKWHKKSIKLHPEFTGDPDGNYAKKLAHFVCVVNTMDAVDVNKTYNAYYRNIRIKHADGTYTDLFTEKTFDPDDLALSNQALFEPTKNASMTLSVVQDPFDKGSPAGPATGVSTLPVCLAAGFSVAALAALLFVISKQRKVSCAK